MYVQLIFRFSVISLLLIVVALEAGAVDTCASAASDPDGDGWGWENEASCRVKGSNGAASRIATATALPEKSPNNELKDYECVDPDGDGWGWIEAIKKSCKMSDKDKKNQALKNEDKAKKKLLKLDTSLKRQMKVASDPSECVDSDGDGWGWNARLKISCEIKAPDPKSPYTVADITDVILVAGQSNALGAGRTPDDILDAPHERVFVWTYSEGWKIASLKTQIWFEDGSPKVGGAGQLVPGFRIAKSIAQKDSKRVVGLISTGVAGMSIKFWDKSGKEFPSILKKVSLALAALPKKTNVDLIWWMQGEADDPHAVDYFAKLRSLVERFRKSGWFSDGYFVANETVGSEVNSIIRRLNVDDDPLTCFSEGEGFLSADKVHFDEPAIRRIGDLVAEKYLNSCGTKRLDSTLLMQKASNS